MGRPALLNPRAWVEQAAQAQAQIDRAFLDQISAEYNALIERVRRERPAEGTSAEDASLRRIAWLGFSMSAALGSAFLPVLRTNVNGALSDIVRKEFEVSEPERKLALRHIEHAVHTFGVLMESIGGVLGEVPPVSIAALFDELADLVKSGDAVMSDTDRVVLRFQLDVMVVLDVLDVLDAPDAPDAPLDELTFWAYQAITSARRVEANPNALNLTGLRGELARVRARRSWLDWDPATLAKELAPWPTPSQ